MPKQTIQLEGGDELDIELPAVTHVDGMHDIYIHRGPRYHQVWHAPQNGGSVGGPSQTRMAIESSRVDVHESQHVIEKAAPRRGLLGFSGFSRRGGGMSPEQIARPAYQDRGQIVDASYEPVPQQQYQALPAPQGHGYAPAQQYQALPAPSGQAPLPHSRPLAIAHQPEQGFSPQMAGTRKFKQV